MLFRMHNSMQIMIFHQIWSDSIALPNYGRLKLKGQNGKIGSIIPQRLGGKRRKPALTSKYQGFDTHCMRWQAVFSSSLKYCRNGTPYRLGCPGYLLTIYSVYPSRVQADSSDKRHIRRRRPPHDTGACRKKRS